MTIRDDYKKADYKLTISMTIRDNYKKAYYKYDYKR